MASSEKDLACYKLDKDTGHRPDIDSKVVVSKTKEQLRSSVPQRNYSCGVHLVLVRGTYHPSKAEVGDLNLATAAQENVGSFDVSVGKVFLFVEVDEAVEKLLHHTLDLRKGELDLIIGDSDKVKI